MRNGRVFGAAAVLGVCGLGASAHPHGYLVSLGHTHDGHHDNKLSIEFDWMMAHTMHHSMFGLPGLSEDMLSFEEIIDDPNDAHWHDDLAFLAEGSKIKAIFTHFDAGVSAYDPFDMGTQLGAPGAEFAIGNGATNFNKKIIWNLDPSAPGFDAGAGVWTASFYLTDSSGTHMDSEVYTMSLKMVPTPGALAMLGVAGLLGGRRRR